MDSSNIDKIIANAVERAKEMQHEYCTLEHLISNIVHNIIRVLTKTSGGTDISYTLYLRT